MTVHPPRQARFSLSPWAATLLAWGRRSHFGKEHDHNCSKSKRWADDKQLLTVVAHLRETVKQTPNQLWLAFPGSRLKTIQTWDLLLGFQLRDMSTPKISSLVGVHVLRFVSYSPSTRNVMWVDDIWLAARPGYVNSRNIMTCVAHVLGLVKDIPNTRNAMWFDDLDDMWLAAQAVYVNSKKY